MSRSYKKTHICKINRKGMKKLANRSVRRETDDVANGNSYRKIFCSYEIAWGITYSDSFDDSFLTREKDRRRAYKVWLQCYKRK